jgi:hypothetical protein
MLALILLNVCVGGASYGVGVIGSVEGEIGWSFGAAMCGVGGRDWVDGFEVFCWGTWDGFGILECGWMGFRVVVCYV